MAIPEVVQTSKVVRESALAEAIGGLATGAALVAGLATKSDLGHSHGGGDVQLVSDGWTGSLRDAGVQTVQDLADWIDANVVVGGGRG